MKRVLVLVLIAGCAPKAAQKSTTPAAAARPAEGPTPSVASMSTASLALVARWYVKGAGFIAAPPARGGARLSPRSGRTRPPDPSA